MPGSVVTVQLGQCGNQVGAELFSTLASEADASAPAARADVHASFFRAASRRAGSEPGSDASRSGAAPSHVARAVLIDMEPKVIHASLRRAKRTNRWAYDPSQTLAFQSGSGNNWARGYNTYGASAREAALGLVRREAERCDALGGFLLAQSMAGGTGAGLGSSFAEALRDEYAHAAILNHCVWPYESGEVIVQSYNALLTLSSLLDVSDGVCVVQNEHLHAACAKLLGIERPTFGDMNAVAAKQLAGVLLPATSRDVSGGTSSASSPYAPRRTMLLHDVARDVCSHPDARLLSLRSVPMMPRRSVDFTTFSWPALLKRARQMLLAGTTLEEGLDWGLEPGDTGVAGADPSRRRATRCVASALYLRGAGSAEADASALADERLYPAWQPEPLRVACSPCRFDGYEMSATLLSNCQTACPPVGRMLGRAYQMYDAGAYVHQYEEHGVGRGHFEEAFARVEDVLAAYRAI